MEYHACSLMSQSVPRFRNGVRRRDVLSSLEGQYGTQFSLRKALSKLTGRECTSSPLGKTKFFDTIVTFFIVRVSESEWACCEDRECTRSKSLWTVPEGRIRSRRLEVQAWCQWKTPGGVSGDFHSMVDRAAIGRC